MHLSQIVVGKDEMHLGGKVAFELGGLDEDLPAFLGAFSVEVIAMNQLLKDQVALWVVGQIGARTILSKLRRWS